MSAESQAKTKMEAVPKKWVPFWSESRDDGDSCYEAIFLGDNVTFLCWNGPGYSVIESLQVRGHEILPDDSSEAPYVFDREELDMLNREQGPVDLASCYDRLHRIVADYYAHIDLRVHKFITLYLIHGYVLTRSIGTAFVWLVGGPRSGKSTLQMIAEKVGYRPFAGVTPSEPSIYRTLGHSVEYGPLVIVKEYQRASEDMKLLAREGDIPGSTTPRCDKENDRQVVHHYHLYGSRLVGSNRTFGDEADADRYHPVKCIHMKPKRPRAELIRDPRVNEELTFLRKDLLLWKVANFGQFCVPFIDPQGRITEGRDWEHYGGIIYLASIISPELEAEVRGYVMESLTDTEKESKDSQRAFLLSIIEDLADSIHLTEGKYQIRSSEIWTKVVEQTKPLIENGQAVEQKRIGPDGHTMTQTSVGRLIKDQLAGHTDRWTDKDSKTVRGYWWLPETLKALRGESMTGQTGSTRSGGIEVKKTRGSLDNETDTQTVSESPEEPLGPVQPIQAVQPVQAAEEADKP